MTMWPIRWSGQEVQDVGLDGVARQRREGQRADEAGRRRGEHHDDVGALGAQASEQLDRLVGGDRAAHAEADQPALEAASGRGPVVGHRRPASIAAPPATSAWRIARPLSVRSGSMTSTPSTPRAHGAADRPPVRIARTSSGFDARRLRELGAHLRQQARRQGLVAEHRARLHRADGVAADGAVGRPELDPRQLGRAGGERLEPQLQARRDGAADVRPVHADAVERRRGPEVDDHGRRAIEAGRRERVDQPVGAHLVRSVHPDGQRHVPGRGDEDRDPVAARDGLGRGGQGGDDRRQRDARDVGERAPIEADQAREQHLQLVGRGCAGRTRPAGRDDRPVRHERERDVGVPDVDREEHAGMIRVPRRAHAASLGPVAPPSVPPSRGQRWIRIFWVAIGGSADGARRRSSHTITP